MTEHTPFELLQIAKRLLDPGLVQDNAGPARPVTLDMYLNVAKELRTQDNRMTSYPMFVVRDRSREFSDSDDATDCSWFTLDNDLVQDHDLRAKLWELYRSRTNDDLHLVELDGETYRRRYYCETTEHVTTCFTQAGAEAYIEEHRHNLCDPYVYVASGHKNAEWQAIRRLLLNLGGEDFSTDKDG